MRSQHGPVERASANEGGAVRVLVMRGSRASIVDLRRVYATTLDGRRVVSLADVWVAAQLPGDLFALSFDFLDDAGSRASLPMREKLDCALFCKGWLDLETREVVWDESADVPRHWRMNGVTTILAEDVVDAASGPVPVVPIARTG
jgi:hypothetical protein